MVVGLLKLAVIMSPGVPEQPCPVLSIGQTEQLLINLRTKSIGATITDGTRELGAIAGYQKIPLHKTLLTIKQTVQSIGAVVPGVHGETL
jgi:hypothetical protein